MTHRWLVSSGGRRGALVGILRSTPGPEPARVMVTDASPLSAAGRLADSFEVVPRIRDDAFVPTMLEIAHRDQIDSVVPTLDPELHVFATHRDDFRKAGTDILISEPWITSLSWDKWEFAKWLNQAGLPTVPTFEVRSLDRTTLTGSVVAKPRNGSSSIGVLLAESIDELPLDELGDEYIIQGAAKGIEFTVDFAVGRAGTFLGAVPRRRLETRAGEVSKAVTVRLKAIEEVIRETAHALQGAYGVLNLQLFADTESDDISIIELNARVGGGYPLSHQAGANFFRAILDDCPISGGSWTDGLVMLRYDDAAFVTSEQVGLR